MIKNKLIHYSFFKLCLFLKLVLRPFMLNKTNSNNTTDEKKILVDKLIDKILNLSDPYKILDVKRNATDKEVDQAFKRLSLKIHPDRAKNKNATDAFQKIQKSREDIIKMRNKKKSYTEDDFAHMRRRNFYSEDDFFDVFHHVFHRNNNLRSNFGFRSNYRYQPSSDFQQYREFMQDFVNSDFNMHQTDNSFFSYTQTSPLDQTSIDPNEINEKFLIIFFVLFIFMIWLNFL